MKNLNASRVTGAVTGLPVQASYHDNHAGALNLNILLLHKWEPYFKFVAALLLIYFLHLTLTGNTSGTYYRYLGWYYRKVGVLQKSRSRDEVQRFVWTSVAILVWIAPSNLHKFKVTLSGPHYDLAIFAAQYRKIGPSRAIGIGIKDRPPS